MTKRRVVMAGAFASVAIAVLAACGSSSVGSGIPRPATASSTATVTVRGTIVEGVKPNCHVLQTASDGRYALSGLGTTALREGDTVAVVGHAAPELVNPCGRTFVVTHLEPRS